MAVWWPHRSLGPAEPAAAGRLDPQPLPRVQLADRLRRQLLAVEQVAPAPPGLAAIRARRGMTPAFGDERVVQRREGLDLADHAVATPEPAVAARAATQRVLHHPHREL